MTAAETELWKIWARVALEEEEILMEGITGGGMVDDGVGGLEEDADYAGTGGRASSGW